RIRVMNVFGNGASVDVTLRYLGGLFYDNPQTTLSPDHCTEIQNLCQIALMILQSSPRGSCLQWLTSQFNRRRFQLSFALAIVLLLSYLFHLDVLPTDYEAPFKDHYARTLSARDLLARPLSQDLTTIPKLIHQTWFPAGSNMSDDAQTWVRTMRSQNADWEYVLWDDETNRMLVEQYFPWFLTDYNRLPKEIHRADVVRNLYMYLFGGMYADVDTEALRPVEPLFTSHSTTLAKHSQILSSGPRKNDHDCTQRGFVGHMAHKEGLDGPAAVPNGWMASPPGHPFWLLPVIHVIENPNGNGDGSVESLTGPGALGTMLHKYYEDFEDSSVRTHVCRTVRRWSPAWDLYCGPEGSEDEVGAKADKMVVLPRQQIYPYSWADDKHPACLAAWGNPDFNPDELQLKDAHSQNGTVTLFRALIGQWGQCPQASALLDYYYTTTRLVYRIQLEHLPSFR
ncbi:hypothetical protein BO83DRAFT_317426, partial [Aspergillus eucalypticola CBS 122712]